MEKKSIREIISVIFKAVTLAMGVAGVVLSFYSLIYMICNINGYFLF